MTKLYCPKGHEVSGKMKNETFNILSFQRLWCKECNRPYLRMDCLNESRKETQVPLDDLCPPLKVGEFNFDEKKDQPEFCFNEKNKVNSPTLKSSEINRIETKISANSPTPKPESHVNDINVVENKVNPSDMQWVNPKRESQVAIERVIEALERVFNYQDVCMLDNELLLQLIIKELKK